MNLSLILPMHIDLLEFVSLNWRDIEKVLIILMLRFKSICRLIKQNLMNSLLIIYF